MVLRREDIAAFQANWDDKAQNLKAIATRLNIGVDSLVFVDDNPIERARIRQSLPMVAVPEMPDDPAHYVRCLADAGYFEAVAFTADDREPSAINMPPTPNARLCSDRPRAWTTFSAGST